MKERAWVKLGSSPSFYADKTLMYASFGNQPVLDAIFRVLPPNGRVLDIGCASGGLLAQLEGVAGYRAGLEISAEAAEVAASVCDEVIPLGVDDPGVPFPARSFDVVVCADVLEHLPDPGAALRRACEWTVEGGAVVICVPNIANWYARLRLLRGVWRYEDLGIWDSGHLRFFTLETLTDLVASAGLDAVSIEATEALSFQFPRLQRLPGPAKDGAARAMARLARWRPQLFGLEFVCIAEKPT